MSWRWGQRPPRAPRARGGYDGPVAHIPQSVPVDAGLMQQDHEVVAIYRVEAALNVKEHGERAPVLRRRAAARPGLHGEPQSRDRLLRVTRQPYCRREITLGS